MSHSFLSLWMNVSLLVLIAAAHFSLNVKGKYYFVDKCFVNYSVNKNCYNWSSWLLDREVTVNLQQHLCLARCISTTKTGRPGADPGGLAKLQRVMCLCSILAERSSLRFP